MLLLLLEDLQVSLKNAKSDKDHRIVVLPKDDAPISLSVFCNKVQKPYPSFISALCWGACQQQTLIDNENIAKGFPNKTIL